MPVLNGVEATQILRQHGVLIPICAVTGNAVSVIFQPSLPFRMFAMHPLPVWLWLISPLLFCVDAPPACL